jgi:hypothetical protein
MCIFHWNDSKNITVFSNLARMQLVIPWEGPNGQGCQGIQSQCNTSLLLEWLYSPCGPSPLYSFLVYSIHNRQDSLNEWSAHRKASTETLDGKWPIILLRGPLLTCNKFTTQVKQLKVPPGGLVPSAGFEPASLESWGGNVTSTLRRPSKFTKSSFILDSHYPKSNSIKRRNHVSIYIFPI